MTPIIKLDSASSVVLSQEQMRRLLSSITDARDRLIFKILYETGCEISELVRIRVQDVKGNKIRFSGRYPKISGKLSKDISQFVRGNNLCNDSYLLTTRQSGHISVKRVRQLVQDYTAEFGSLNPQMLRYHHILHAYANGVFIENIAVQLGLTRLRVFEILERFSPKTENRYGNFLRRVG